MTLDPGTVRFYQDKCAERVHQLMDRLATDLSDEETRLTRARLKAFKEMQSWKPDQTSNETGTTFF